MKKPQTGKGEFKFFSSTNKRASRQALRPKLKKVKMRKFLAYVFTLIKVDTHIKSGWASTCLFTFEHSVEHSRQDIFWYIMSPVYSIAIFTIDHIIHFAMIL